MRGSLSQIKANKLVLRAKGKGDKLGLRTSSGLPPALNSS